MYFFYSHTKSLLSFEEDVTNSTQLFMSYYVEKGTSNNHNFIIKTYISSLVFFKISATLIIYLILAWIDSN